MFWNLPGKLENLKKFRELSAFVFIYNKMLNCLWFDAQHEGVFDMKTHLTGEKKFR